jgi:hypothetical protein
LEEVLARVSKTFPFTVLATGKEAKTNLPRFGNDNKGMKAVKSGAGNDPSQTGIWKYGKIAGTTQPVPAIHFYRKKE